MMAFIALYIVLILNSLLSVIIAFVTSKHLTYPMLILFNPLNLVLTVSGLPTLYLRVSSSFIASHALDLPNLETITLMERSFTYCHTAVFESRLFKPLQSFLPDVAGFGSTTRPVRHRAQSWWMLSRG